MIEIAFESDTVMTGHFIAAHLRWSAQSARRIVVAAEWQATAFNGTTHGVGRSLARVPSRGEQTGAFPVRLLIPHEGPVSFSGEVIRIEWNLWARIEIAGKNEFAHCPFRVIPRRAT